MFKRLKNEEGGAVAVIVAIVLIALMAGVALTVDVGALMLRRREMVNGADAAAHAAALTYMRTGSQSQGATSAKSLFEQNAPRGGTLVSIKWTGTQQGGTVTVVYTTQQELYFAPVLGFDDEHTVGSTAEASWKMDGAFSAGNTTYRMVESDRFYYVCKYTGIPPAQKLSLTASGPRPASSSDWGTGGPHTFNDRHDSYVIATGSRGGTNFVPAVNPAVDCPQPGPHVWLSK